MPYRDLVMAKTPVAYYRLNESAGATQAVDETANARHAVYAGTPTLGVVGALRFDDNKAVAMATTGAGAAAATYARALSMPSAGAFSAECWVQFATTNSDTNQAMMERCVGDSTNTDWLLYYEGDRVSWRVCNDAAGSTYTTIISPTNHPRDTWLHVVGTYGASTMRLYINGQQVATSAHSRTVAKGAGNLWLGRLGTAPEYGLNGRLDEAAFYHRVLTAAEVQEHYAEGALKTFTGLPLVASTQPIIMERGFGVALPQADVPMARPTNKISGIVYNTGTEPPEPVAGATVLLVRDIDGVAVQQGFSGPGGHYSFPRSSTDKNTYYVVAFSLAGGTTQVHGTSNRGLVPQPSGEA